MREENYKADRALGEATSRQSKETTFSLAPFITVLTLKAVTAEAVKLHAPIDRALFPIVVMTKTNFTTQIF